MIAGHAVVAACAHCGRPVRSTLVLHAELADLRNRLRLSSSRLAQDSSHTAQAAYDLEVAAIDLQLAALRAELRGVHLLCSLGQSA